MEKFKILLLSFALITFAFCFQECKSAKKKEVPAPNSLVGQFLKLKPGSSLVYVYAGPSSSDTLKDLVIDSIKVAFGKNFQTFQTLDQNGKEGRDYYAFKDGNYYQLIKIPSGEYVEINYLKDSCELGKKWNSIVNFSGNNVLYQYEVVEKDITKIVKGQTFKNVVHVKVKIPSIGAAGDNYFAPSVGSIRVENVIASQNYVGELLNYNLK